MKHFPEKQDMQIYVHVPFACVLRMLILDACCMLHVACYD